MALHMLPLWHYYLEMHVKLHQIAILSASCAITATSAQAQTSDPRASDGVQFFKAFCMASEGTRDRALVVLGNGNALARRLPDDVVRQTQGGREGGVGWTIRSPNNAELLLDYDARGICGLRIREADEASVRDTFEALMKAVTEGAGAEFVSVKPTSRTVDGVKTTYYEYSYPIGTRKAHLGLTTAERTVGNQQHFMTFGFVQ